MLNGIQAQTYVFERGAEYWSKLKEWNAVRRVLSPKEIGILEIACLLPAKFPSEKQAPILINAEKRAVEEGFYVHS